MTRTAEKKIVPLIEIQKVFAKNRPLKLEITIPARAVPLFQSMCTISGRKPNEMAAIAVLKYIVGEEMMTIVDKEVSELINAIPD